jgi:aspartate kinase
VDGVYTADPRIVPNARKLNKISYEEMLELASLGAKVLQIRSVEMAMKYKVPLWVKSSFTPLENQPQRGVEGEAPSGLAGGGGDASPYNNVEGTVVTAEDKDMEQIVVSGVAADKNEAKIAVRRLADRPGIASQLFESLAGANINVDMIIQNVSEDGFTDLTFTIPKADLKNALRLAESVGKEIGAGKVESADNIAKVSIVGVGMRSHSGVAAKMFTTLAKEKINIQMISTSEIKISVVVDDKQADAAVKALHKAFIG